MALRLRMAGSPTYDEYLRAIIRDPENDEPRLDLARSIRPYEPDLAAFIDMPVSRTASLRPITDEGRALAAAHGELPWLWLRNRVSRFDARWAVEHGRRPVRRAPPAGSDRAAGVIRRATGSADLVRRAEADTLFR